jgi:hypothetical protein
VTYLKIYIRVPIIRRRINRSACFKWKLKINSENMFVTERLKRNKYTQQWHYLMSTNQLFTTTERYYRPLESSTRSFINTLTLISQHCNCSYYQLLLSINKLGYLLHFRVFLSFLQIILVNILPNQPHQSKSTVTENHCTADLSGSLMWTRYVQNRIPRHRHQWAQRGVRKANVRFYTRTNADSMCGHAIWKQRQTHFCDLERKHTEPI